MTVWIIGRIVGGNAGWVLEGVEATEQAAAARCRDASWLIGPVEIGVPMPAGEQPWPGAYYPCAS